VSIGGSLLSCSAGLLDEYKHAVVTMNAGFFKRIGKIMNVKSFWRSSSSIKRLFTLTIIDLI
jgi:hypothetical protein